MHSPDQQVLMDEMSALNVENLNLNRLISGPLASQKESLDQALSDLDDIISQEVESQVPPVDFFQESIERISAEIAFWVDSGIPNNDPIFTQLYGELNSYQQGLSDLPRIRADIYNQVLSNFQPVLNDLNNELSAINDQISEINRTIANNDQRINTLSVAIANMENQPDSATNSTPPSSGSSSNQTSQPNNSGMSPEVAALTDEQRADLYSQVGDLIYNPDWNLAAHIAGNMEDGVFIAPSFNSGKSESNPDATLDWGSLANELDIDLSPWETDIIDSTIESPSENQSSEKNVTNMSAVVAALTDEQRADLYSQVGDLIYNPDWNLAAHIAGNMENGVFTAPSFEFGKSQPNADASIDWGSLAIDLGLDLTPWESVDNVSRELLGDNINYMADKPSDDVMALTDELKQDLFKQVGNAMFAPGFNLAAHIAANTFDGVFIPPNSSAGEDDNQTESIDWLKVAEERALDISAIEYNFIPVNAWDDASQIAMPIVGSDAWQDLMEETGGAAELPGFNYLSHIAATTSQTILPQLSEDQVRAIIIETGTTNFTEFDYDDYVKEKTQATELSFKIAATQGLHFSSEDILIGSKKNDRLDFSTSKIDKKLIASGDGDDIIKATKGNNIIVAGTGNDEVDGGDGLDSLVIKAKRLESDIKFDKLTNKWLVTSDNDGNDSVTNVERLVFEDQAVALDVNGNAGQSYRLYKAAFDRDPMQGDTSGLGFWINASDNGVSLLDISEDFISSDEFVSLYGEAPSNEDFLTALYKNVLDRTPDGDGYDWWLEQMELNPDLSRAQLLTDFSESQENYQNVESLVENGIVYDIFVN